MRNRRALGIALGFDIQEMECSPSDQKHYYEFFGGLTGDDPSR